METAASSQVGIRRWKTWSCTLEVGGDGVTDKGKGEGEGDVGFFSDLDLEPIRASRSQADAVVGLELRTASANLRLGQSDVQGVCSVEMSDFSLAYPQSGSGAEVSLSNHDTIELGAAIQEGLSPAGHIDIVP